MSAGAQHSYNSAPQVSLSALFFGFLRLGVTAFGGPAMVAYIRDLAVKKKDWLSAETFADGVALCQSIPGATAMQTAAYVGLRARGARGAAAAFAGFGLPAFILMTSLSALYRVGSDFPLAASAFRGLHVIVVALVANAVVNFARSATKNWRDVILGCAAAVFLYFRGSPILAIVAAALVGAVAYRSLVGAAALPKTETRAGGHPIRTALAGAVLIAAGLAILFFLNRLLFNLAAVMLKVDLCAFGGGFASVPVMLHEIVDIRGWMDGNTFMDGIALGQITPGPIVITATFVGYQIAGLAGAIAGTVAIFTPSFLMVLTTVPYLDSLRGSLLFRRALRGVLASFVGLLLAVTVQFAIEATWTSRSIPLALAAFAALRLKIDVLWVVLAGTAASILLL